ncbi:hypothetical protein TEQG_08849 [Trichophyton equinum CBS 127.97]|uniref:Uncharacterized protein n=1 Tax=Trichophyton equinum (strain ATCC MYA-4606 / CBS 127.97) TaxID=559882 RepID=F2Q5M9_TRIEC|nr:hypothetical protein TEQG_08849 [Trichophyton equinum CBS 127.97]
MIQTKKPTGQAADAPPSPPSSPTHERRMCVPEDEPMVMDKFLASAKPTSAGHVSPEHPHSSPATTPPSGYPIQDLPKHPHSSPSSTPPPNYSTPCIPSFVTREELKDILVEVLRARESSGTV